MVGPVAIVRPSMVPSSMPEKRGSTPSLKVSRISFGDVATAPPTGGIAWSRKA
jgi:hypothetical protein